LDDHPLYQVFAVDVFQPVRYIGQVLDQRFGVAARINDRVCPASRHGHQPGRKSLDVAQIRQVLVQVQPNLLENIGYVLGLWANCTRHGINEALIASYQFSPRLLVALHAPRD
jgi:hypothetical protein